MLHVTSSFSDFAPFLHGYQEGTVEPLKPILFIFPNFILNRSHSEIGLHFHTPPRMTEFEKMRKYMGKGKLCDWCTDIQPDLNKFEKAAKSCKKAAKGCKKLQKTYVFSFFFSPIFFQLWLNILPPQYMWILEWT